MTNTIQADAAKRLIAQQLAAHEGGIATRLAEFDAESAIDAWHSVIRSVEEFINLPLFGLDDDEDLALWLLALPLGAQLEANPGLAIEARDRIAAIHGAAIARRFLLTILQISQFGHAWAARGQSLGPEFSLDTVAGAMAYFQSRRRHMVSLLYQMAGACRGAAKLEVSGAFGALLPLIEHCCIQVTTWSQNAVLAEVYPDFALHTGVAGGYASHHFDPLEGFFLEPERASIMTMAEVRREQIAPIRSESLDPALIFSAAELRNNVRFIQAVYEAFGVNDGPFSALSQLIIAFTRHTRDDYYITLDASKFRSMLAAQDAIPADELERLLVNAPSSYRYCSNAYEPFLAIGTQVVTNVGLLSRFLYAFKNVHLGSRRRFQIHAGFIFEDQVRLDLAKAGFRDTQIKRINRKEFDVVTVRSGVIYNFQCKNNWVDLAKVEADPKLFARFNRSLVRYYRAALRKEVKREDLLKAELGLAEIRHFVVSRFPVICEDPEIINYNIFAQRIPTLAA